MWNLTAKNNWENNSGTVIKVSMYALSEVRSICNISKEKTVLSYHSCAYKT